MRGADRTAGAVLLALAVAFGAGALRQYAYWGANGPGPAFLPFWLGVVMAVLATLLLVQAWRSADPGAPWLPGMMTGPPSLVNRASPCGPRRSS